MKSRHLILLVSLCFSSFVFAQKPVEGAVTFVSGKDLAFLNKKTKIKVNVISDSLYLNDCTPDTLEKHLANIYHGDGIVKKLKRHREELFPKFFCDALEDRLNKLKVEARLDTENPDLIMNVYMMQT